MACSPACSCWRCWPSSPRASSARSKSGSSSGDLIASAAKYQFREEKRSMHGSRRRAFVAAGGAVAVAIALAACGGTSHNTRGGTARVKPGRLQPTVERVHKEYAPYKHDPEQLMQLSHKI